MSVCLCQCPWHGACCIAPSRLLPGAHPRDAVGLISPTGTMGAGIREMLLLRDLTNRSSGPPRKAGKSPAPSFFGDQERKHREALLIYRMASPSEPNVGFSEWRKRTSPERNRLTSCLVEHLDKPSWLFVGLGHVANKSAAFEFNTRLCPQSQQELCSLLDS